MRLIRWCYHVVMARKHTKAARPVKPATQAKPRIVRKAATPQRKPKPQTAPQPTLSLNFGGQSIDISGDRARILLAELCNTATQNIQTFHAVQREVEAQRMKMREEAKSGGITTSEVLNRCAQSGYPCSRVTIDRAVAAGELPAFVTIGLAGHYRMIRPEDFEKWNRARIARITRKDTP